MSVNIALLQLAVDDTEPVYERVPRVIGMIRQAAQRAELIVLPELWPTGAFSYETMATHAQPLDGPLMDDLSAVAAECGVWLHGGSFVEASGGDLFNTSVLFAPDGRLVASYPKIHLFGFDGGETTLLSGKSAAEAWLKEIGADEKKLHPNGGAIALGHPLGGSGARIMTTMLYHMRDNNIRYGLQTMCEGGGQANATILELL